MAMLKIQSIGLVLGLILFAKIASGEGFPLMSSGQKAKASDAVAILRFQNVRDPSVTEIKVLQKLTNPHPEYLHFQIAEFSVEGFLKGDGPESIRLILLEPKSEHGQGIFDSANFRRGRGKLKFADGTDGLVTYEYLAYLKLFEGSLFTLTYGGADQERSIRLVIPPF